MGKIGILHDGHSFRILIFSAKPYLLLQDRGLSYNIQL